MPFALEIGVSILLGYGLLIEHITHGRAYVARPQLFVEGGQFHLDGFVPF